MIESRSNHDPATSRRACFLSVFLFLVGHSRARRPESPAAACGVSRDAQSKSMSNVQTIFSVMLTSGSAFSACRASLESTMATGDFGTTVTRRSACFDQPHLQSAHEPVHPEPEPSPAASCAARTVVRTMSKLASGQLGGSSRGGLSRRTRGLTRPRRLPG